MATPFLKIAKGRDKGTLSSPLRNINSGYFYKCLLVFLPCLPLLYENKNLSVYINILSPSD